MSQQANGKKRDNQRDDLCFFISVALLYARHTKIRYERRDAMNIPAVRQVSSPESWCAAHIDRGCRRNEYFVHML
ncbi:MAG: hypothetical protein HY231_16545 [Acidobacteria bacterium]|nr:hypothetical protein [Acidobacteriota bacterium]